MHPHERHTSTPHQRARVENSKGVTQFLADTRHTVLHGSSPSWGLVAVKIPRGELFLKDVMGKGWKGRDEVEDVR